MSQTYRISTLWVQATLRPRKDSNLRTRFRKPMLYPLSYGGDRADATKDRAGIRFGR
jgi:hypothetical protein